MSPRFAAIIQALRPGFPVYDLCCDHGLIGRYAYELHRCRPVHFVDQSPAVIARLRQRLDSLVKLTEHDVQIWQLAAEHLPAAPSPSDFVLAGVGIPTTIRILDALFPDGLGEHRLILAPQQKTPPLRAYLIRRQVRLISEQVLLERGRYREILVVGAQGQRIEPDAATYRNHHDPVARAYWKYLQGDQETIRQLRQGRDAPARLSVPTA